MWLLSKEGLAAPVAASTNERSARASSMMWSMSKEGIAAPATRGESGRGDKKRRAQGERKGEKGEDGLPPVSAIVLIAKRSRELRDEGGQSAARRGDELRDEGDLSAAQRRVEAGRKGPRGNKFDESEN